MLSLISICHLLYVIEIEIWGCVQLPMEIKSCWLPLMNSLIIWWLWRCCMGLNQFYVSYFVLCISGLMRKKKPQHIYVFLNNLFRNILHVIYIYIQSKGWFMFRQLLDVCGNKYMGALWVVFCSTWRIIVFLLPVGGRLWAIWWQQVKEKNGKALGESWVLSGGWRDGCILLSITHEWAAVMRTVR